MRRSRLAAGLAVLAGLTAACSSGSEPGPASDAERDCNAVITASRGIILVDPRLANEDDIETVTAAAERLTDAAQSATTDVAEPARAMALTATDYAEALSEERVQRAATRQGLLRQQAEPIAEACGESAARILGNSI